MTDLVQGTQMASETGLHQSVRSLFVAEDV